MTDPVQSIIFLFKDFSGWALCFLVVETEKVTVCQMTYFGQEEKRKNEKSLKIIMKRRKRKDEHK